MAATLHPLNARRRRPDPEVARRVDAWRRQRAQDSQPIPSPWREVLEECGHLLLLAGFAGWLAGYVMASL